MHCTPDRQTVRRATYVVHVHVVVCAEQGQNHSHAAGNGTKRRRKPRGDVRGGREALRVVHGSRCRRRNSVESRINVQSAAMAWKGTLTNGANCHKAVHSVSRPRCQGVEQKCQNLIGGRQVR